MSSPSRQDDEHRLAKLVSEWISARAQKADAIHEHNEVIKKLEESIESISRSIQGGQYQPTLPFEESSKPAIVLSETDPDVQDAETAEEETAADDPAACLHCGHPEGVHGATGTRGCMRADCECKGYVHPNPLDLPDAEPEKREAEL